MVGDAQTHAGTGTSHSHTLTHAQNCHTGVATLRILSLYHCTLVRTSFVRIYSPVPIPLPIHAHYRLLIHIFTQKIVQVRNKTSENAYTLDESGGKSLLFSVLCRPQSFYLRRQDNRCAIRTSETGQGNVLHYLYNRKRRHCQTADRWLHLARLLTFAHMQLPYFIYKTIRAVSTSPERTKKNHFSTLAYAVAWSIASSRLRTRDAPTRTVAPLLPSLSLAQTTVENSRATEGKFFCHYSEADFSRLTTVTVLKTSSLRAAHARQQFGYICAYYRFKFIAN